MKKFDLDDRLIQFACDIIVLANNIPKSYAGQTMAKQITRSGTSPALNYAEAKRAESRRDFVHKLKIALKETSETRSALRIIKGSKLNTSDEVDRLLNEADQLVAIFTTSINTTKQNMRKQAS